MKQQGVTLIEMIIVIVVMGIASTTLLSMIAQTNRHAVDPQLKQQALTIANAYFNEMSGYAYPSDPTCPAVTVARTAYSDLCHFNLSINETPWDLANQQSSTSLSGYQVTVTISSGGNIALGDGVNSLSSAQDIVLMTVVVTMPDSQTLTLSRYRADW